MDFAARNFKELRKKSRFSQNDFASILGTSQAVVSQYEKGTRSISDKTIKVIADFYRLMPADIKFRELAENEIMEACRKSQGAENIDVSGGISPSYPDYSVSNLGKKIGNLLDKHVIGRGEFAEDILKVSLRTLQRYISGEAPIPGEHLIMMAEYLGESLDVFRNTPLPKGHYLQRIKDLEQIVHIQSQLIATLEHH